MPLIPYFLFFLSEVPLSMEFFKAAISALLTLVIALCAGLGMPGMPPRLVLVQHDGMLSVTLTIAGTAGHVAQSARPV